MLHRRTVLRIVAAVAVLATAGLAGFGTGASASQDPAVFVKTLGDRAIGMLTGDSVTPAERERRFRVLLRESFDVDRIGRFVLGRYARQASTAELQEYRDLFEDMIVVTYASRFGEYSGQTFTVNRVTGKEGDADSIVMTSINPPEGGPAIRIDWQVRRSDGEMKIVDVRVEGVSMSVTQRDEFTAVIRQNNGELGALLDALRDKTAHLKSK